jgi:hypothetical protein
VARRIASTAASRSSGGESAQLSAVRSSASCRSATRMIRSITYPSLADLPSQREPAPTVPPSSPAGRAGRTAPR